MSWHVRGERREVKRADRDQAAGRKPSLSRPIVPSKDMLNSSIKLSEPP